MNKKSTYIQHPDKETRVTEGVAYPAVRVNNRPNPFTGQDEVTFKIPVKGNKPDVKIGKANFAYLDLLDDLGIDEEKTPKTVKCDLTLEKNDNGFYDIGHISID